MSEELSILHLIQNSVDAICSVNNSHSPNESQLRREGSQNHRNFYALLTFFFLNLLCFAFGSTYQWKFFLFILVLILLTGSVFILTCKINPIIYKITNAIVFTVAGPASLLISHQNIFSALPLTFLGPPLVLFLCDKKFWAYASFVFQYIALNMLYFPMYQTILLSSTYADLSEIAELQFNTYNFIYLFNALLLYILSSFPGSSSSGANPPGGSFSFQAKPINKFVTQSQSLVYSLVKNLDIAQLEENPVKSKNFLNTAKVCADVLFSKVNTIIDLEEPKLETHIMPVRTTLLFERIWEVASELMKKKNLFGTLTLQRTVPFCLALDQSRLTQIVLNVLINAVRFTDKGNVGLSLTWLDDNTITNKCFEPEPFDEEGGIGEIRANTLARPVGRGSTDENRASMLDTNQKKFFESAKLNQEHQHHSAVRKGILKITISDTGCGMTENESKNIFQLYNKSLSNLSPSNPTVRGFNLYMTNELCNRMGGSMRVYSRPKKGTTVIICIPTSSAELESSDKLDESFVSSAHRRDSARSQKKIRGLLVDENPFTQEAVKEYLEHSEVEVAGVVKHKEDLMELFEREVRQRRPVQMVAIHAQYSLPEAKAICEKIRQFETQQNLENCAVLFLAEKYTEAELKECLSQKEEDDETKINYFIRTPCSMGEFQEVIKRIITAFVPEPAEPFHPKKVLIVDDNTFNLTLLKQLLEKHCGYLSAENGEKAVEVYQNNWRDIAIIFMDCQMPVMDGYEATRLIRKFQKGKKITQIKILGVTGNVGSQYDNYCKEAGMNGTVTKPFSAEDIHRTVREALLEYQ